MNRSLVLLAALALCGLGVPAAAVFADETAAPPTAPALESLYLELAPADPAKAAGVEAALRAVAGVDSVEWTVAAKEVRVVRRQGTAADADLVKAVGGAGATATRVPVARADIVFEKQLHCAGCAAKVERALKKVAGTKEADVNADRTGVTVVYDTRTGKVEAMRRAIVDAGYPVKP